MVWQSRKLSPQVEEWEVLVKYKIYPIIGRCLQTVVDLYKMKEFSSIRDLAFPQSMGEASLYGWFPKSTSNALSIISKINK